MSQDSTVKRKRNPPWSRDELILALELYLRSGLLDDKSAQVIELSNILRQLASVEQNDPGVFRNPNGVAMKLGNFASLDPIYTGKGLSAGGKGDKLVWDEFCNDKNALSREAAKLKAFIKTENSNQVSNEVQRQESGPQNPFDPDSIKDERKILAATIVSRRGQGQFRQSLIAAYEGRCAISGYDSVEALEAAHILGYMGKKSQHVCNGLLLRADLHTLFDLGLIAVDVSNVTVAIAEELQNTMYLQFQGKQLNLPRDPSAHPSKTALAMHFSASKCSGILDS